MRDKIVSFLLILFAFVFCAVALASAKGKEEGLENKLHKQRRESLTRSEQTARLLQKERQELEQRLQELKQQLQRNKSRLKQAEETYLDLEEKEVSLRRELAEEKETIAAVQDTVKASAGEAATMLRTSYVAPRLEAESKVLDRILERDHFPDMQEIKGLTNFYFRYQELAGEIKKIPGEYIDATGEKIKGSIIGIGDLGALYLDADNQAGYLLSKEQSNTLQALSGSPSWLVRRALQKYATGQSNHLPLDISGGTAFKRLSREKDVLQWLQSGGLLIWPIIFVGALAFMLIMERLIFLLRLPAGADKVVRNVFQLAEAEKWDECRKYCDKMKKHPVCRVIRDALQHLGQKQQMLESALQESILRQLPRLERFLSTLNILAAISPLLGLLGTVTGMIKTFEVLNIFGSGDPKLMAGGISEALITTELGLIVAVIVLFVHHLLEKRVDRIVGDMEEKGNAFLLVLIGKKQVISEK